MGNELNLKEMYLSVYDSNIKTDFAEISSLIDELNEFVLSEITISKLEKYLKGSNEIKLLINNIKNKEIIL